MNLYKVILINILFNFISWSDEKPFPKIEIKPNIWGGASVNDIQKILHSATMQIWPHTAQKTINDIYVERSRSGPIILFRRGEEGEYLMQLDTEKTYWCQYAFQFSHEFGHIICGYKKGNRSNLWFEETICETLSLFVLRKMSLDWKKNSPYPKWKEYSKEFANYAQNRLQKSPWPKEQTLAYWYASKKNSLIKKPTDRQRNVQLASKLLPLFEENPSLWGSCAYLNINKSYKKKSFPCYLNDWKKNCQKHTHQEFVEKLALQFGIKL